MSSYFESLFGLQERAGMFQGDRGQLVEDVDPHEAHRGRGGVVVVDAALEELLVV
jgi:hypothetical protein